MNDFITYEEWAKNIEEEFDRLKSERFLGFRKAIEQLIGEPVEQTDDNDTATRNLADSFKKFKRNYEEQNNSGNNAEDMLLHYVLNIIAKHFYQDIYKYYVEHGSYKSDTDFYSSNGSGHYKNIKNYFMGESVPVFTGKHIYGFEICSALQLESKYTAFKSFEELNNFVMSLNDLNKPNTLSCFGFYLRNVEELCIAYSLLRGYSSKEAESLVEQAKECVKNKQDKMKNARPVNMTLTKAVKKDFKKFFTGNLNQYDKKSEELFLAQIQQHSSEFIPVGQKNNALDKKKLKKRSREFIVSELKKYIKIIDQEAKKLNDEGDKIYAEDTSDRAKEFNKGLRAYIYMDNSNYNKNDYVDNLLVTAWLNTLDYFEDQLTDQLITLIQSSDTCDMKHFYADIKKEWDEEFRQVGIHQVRSHKEFEKFVIFNTFFDGVQESLKGLFNEVENEQIKYFSGTSKGHWSTLKELALDMSKLGVLSESDYERLISEDEELINDLDLQDEIIEDLKADVDDAKKIVDGTRSEKERWEKIIDILKNSLINIDNVQNNEICKYLLYRLNILKSYNITDIRDKSNIRDKSFNSNEIRDIFILSTMKLMRDLPEAKKCYALSNPTQAVEIINKKLDAALLRQIEYILEGEEIICSSGDVFDWFVVECIKRDAEEQYNKSINKNGNITGFGVFKRFLEGEEE